MATYESLVAGGYFSADPHDRTLPVSVRCNNPGALNSADWIRAMPGYVTEHVTTPGNSTAIFRSPEEGVAAWWELMHRYRLAGAKTLGRIISRYGGGQDYSAYVAFVSHYVGIAADQEVDLMDDAVLCKFAKAMFRYESGRATPLSDDQIRFGFALGRKGSQ